MLLSRVKTAIILLILGLSVIFLGGWYYFAFISIILLLAAKEFTQIFNKGGYRPNKIIVLLTITIILIFRYLFEFEHSDLILTVSFLVTMGFHAIQFEQGREKAPIDFSLTLAAILYFGWIGGYFISIMFLPNGRWWLLLSIAIIALSDSGAYFIGSHYGKHKMSPKTSPKKSWEGYFGGILFGVIGGMLVGLGFHQFNPEINLLIGLILGGILSSVTPLGDLGESMFKRYFNIKDSSNLLPGHGGAMDRIDTWVWAVSISFYLIIWFF